MDPAALSWIRHISELSGPGVLALLVVGFLRGWIWPSFAVADVRQQRDALLKQNERLSTALSRCLSKRDA